MALLCSMVLDNSLKTSVDSSLFHSPANRAVYEGLSSMIDKGVPIDFVTAQSFIDVDKQYLDRIWSYVPSPANWKHYRDTLIEKKDRRSAIEVGKKLVDVAHEAPVEELEHIAHSFCLTRSPEETQEGIKTAHQLANDLVSFLEGFQDEGKEDSGVEWGFDGLPSLVPKLRPGNLYVVGGFPGSGKTSIFNSHVALSCVPSKRPALIFSFEMTSREEASRLVSIAGRVPLSVCMGESDPTTDQFSQIAKAATDLSNSGVAIVDEIISLSEIIDRSRSHKPSLVCVDNAQLLARFMGDGTDEGMFSQLPAISGRLKLLAKELQCPVILVTQINRADMLPYGSDQLRADSDTYMIIRDSDEDAIKKIWVRKNRNGKTGEVQCSWFGNCAAFYDGGL